MVMKRKTRSGNQQGPPPPAPEGAARATPHPILGNSHTAPLVSSLVQEASILLQIWRPAVGLSEVFFPLWTPISSSIVNQRLGSGTGTVPGLQSLRATVRQDGTLWF